MIDQYIAELVRQAVLDAVRPLSDQLAVLSRQAGAPVAAAETEWLTTAEVGARLAVAAETVQEWIRKGRMPATRVGRSWRVRQTDVVNFMALPTCEADAGKVTALTERIRRAGQRKTGGKP